MKKYSSVERHGKRGTNLTVEGKSHIVISEKIDGANASFKRDGDEVLAFSRKMQLNDENNLRGFYKWVKDNIKVDDLEEGFIYFGEWTAKHKLDYGDNHNKFYVFDLYDESKEEYLPLETLITHTERLGLNLVPILYEGEFQSIEHIQSFVGKSILGEIGEGVIVKNYDYRDRFGSQVFTKFVSDEFAEMSKTRKHIIKSDPLTEYINSTLTEARVSKMIHKLVDEGILVEDYAIEDMGLILRGLGASVYEDIIKEELDELLKIVRQRVGKAVPNVIKQVLANEGKV